MSTTDNSRRTVFKLAATALMAPSLLACGAQADAGMTAPPPEVSTSVEAFAASEPKTSHALMQLKSSKASWAVAHQPDLQLFVGSAVKTFILAQFLRDAETGYGGVSENHACQVSDLFRSPGSPVFEELSGQTPYRSALEAMITHSDNTATDIALAATTPARVRTLIAEAGLQKTQIPDSTRKLFSYLAGAEDGVDLGWSAMQAIDRGESLGLNDRTNAINDKQSMLSSANDMVHWYQQALAGAFFSTASARQEFSRIHAAADAIWRTVPPGILAFGKGGSLDWKDFHCLCFSGQMVVGEATATFCFTQNWRGTQSSINRTNSFIQAVADVLRPVAAALRA